ncbi:MAG: glycosyltransferase family 4 protein [Microcoleaceae cyanobacterium]
MNQTQNQDLSSMRILMIVENISRKMGGESGKSFYYLQLLHERNIEVFTICHERVREEVRQEFMQNPEQLKKIYFIEDTFYQVLLWRMGEIFPYRIKDLVFNQLIHLITQYRARKLVKKLIAEHNIDLIFEPAPITPKGLSFMYNLGKPVVIGPLSGGLEFPPAFQYMDSRLSRLFIRSSRLFSELLNQLIPGKRQADTLIVANPQTQAALPKGCQGKLYQMIESGVDIKTWEHEKIRSPQPHPLVRFIYVGRFVDWKGIEFLIAAFQKVVQHSNAILELVGDGSLQQPLKNKAKRLGIEHQIQFHGWQPREKVIQYLCESDVFVMPSLREAGGNSILEAMAIGLPVIVADWAGPSQIVDSSCGIRVAPTSPEQYIEGLATAMIDLANSPQLRQQMGQAAKQRVQRDYFDWHSKCDRIVEIFSETLEQCSK